MSLVKCIQISFLILLPSLLVSMENSFLIQDKFGNFVKLQCTQIDWTNNTADNILIKSLISPQYAQIIDDVSLIYSQVFGLNDSAFLETVKVGPKISGRYYLFGLHQAHSLRPGLSSPLHYSGKYIGVAGFIVADNDQTTAYLEPLAILPESQGIGLARLLIFSIRRVKPEIKSIFLNVEQENKHAVDVYEHCDFKRVGEFIADDGKIILQYQWNKRESILDRVEQVESDLKQVPFLPPICDEMPELKKGFIDVENGGKLYYEEEGSGLPIILLNPGPGGSHHCFHPHFSRLNDRFRVIYYDARGTGKSSIDQTGKTYTIRQAVEDLEHLRKTLKIDKWAVLGWSFGGFLAQCYALTYPEHIMGLILVAAGDGLTNVKMNPSREQIFISDTERDAISKIYLAEDEGKISPAQTIFNKDLCGDWKRQHYYKPTVEELALIALYEWNPAPGFNNLMSNDMDKISLDNKFDNFVIPTLVMEARWDLTWDTDKAEFIRKNHPHAQFEYFEISGHKIFADEPGKFFTLLNKFLSSLTEASYPCIDCKIQWPEPISGLSCKFAIVRSMPQSSMREKLMLECYEQALRDSVTDNSIWGSLVYNFIKARDCDKALVALQNSERSLKATSLKSWQEFGYCIKAWQGHILDLIGKREQAVNAYEEALQIMNGEPVEDSCGIKIDRQWLKDRLKSPFTSVMLK